MDVTGLKEKRQGFLSKENNPRLATYLKILPLVRKFIAEGNMSDNNVENQANLMVH